MRRLSKFLVILLILSWVTGALGIFNTVYASPGSEGWVRVTSVPTNANASIGVIPTFGHIGAVALNDELYCYGGINQHEKSTGYVWFGVNEKYNLETDTWTKVESPAQGSFALVAYQNRIYSIGTQTKFMTHQQILG